MPTTILCVFVQATTHVTVLVCDDTLLYLIEGLFVSGRDADSQENSSIELVQELTNHFIGAVAGCVDCESIVYRFLS